MGGRLYTCPGSRRIALRARRLVLGTGAPPPCVCEAPQACCLGGGDCDMLTPSECVRLRGQPMGDGTDCNGRDCQGACCTGNGECSRMGFAPCFEQLSGNWLGFGTQCSPNPCPVFGACCQAGVCTQTLAADCPGTWFQGLPCSPNPCPPACCLNNSCCYRIIGPNQVVSTLQTQFTLNYKRCCSVGFQTCPTYQPPLVTASFTANGSANLCGNFWQNLTTVATAFTPGAAYNCPGTGTLTGLCGPDPWVGWSASLALENLRCVSGVPTITRRLRINTDTATVLDLSIPSCASMSNVGTHNENQPEFCGAAQALMSFGYNSTLSITNVAPCNPEAFRMFDYRTTAGGLLIPGRVLPRAGMTIAFSGDSGQALVVAPSSGGCSGCGSAPGIVGVRL